MKKYLILLITAVIMIMLCNSCKKQTRVYTASSLPMVHLKDSTKYLINPDTLINEETEDSINKVLSKLEHLKGIQTVYAVVNNIDNPDDMSKFCSDLGNKYGVGNKKTDKGLIIIIAVEQKKWFIAPGKGLEGEFPDIICKEIGSTYIESNMNSKSPNINKAALSTTNAIYNKATINQLRSKSEQRKTYILYGSIAIILILILSFKKSRHIFFAFISAMGSGTGGFGGSSGSSGGSFGGGSFGGGGAGGGW